MRKGKGCVRGRSVRVPSCRTGVTLYPRVATYLDHLVTPLAELEKALAITGHENERHLILRHPSASRSSIFALRLLLRPLGLVRLSFGRTVFRRRVVPGLFVAFAPLAVLILAFLSRVTEETDVRVHEPLRREFGQADGHPTLAPRFAQRRIGVYDIDQEMHISRMDTMFAWSDERHDSSACEEDYVKQFARAVFHTRACCTALGSRA